jgi:hypothetical protein
MGDEPDRLVSMVWLTQGRTLGATTSTPVVTFSLNYDFKNKKCRVRFKVGMKSETKQEDAESEKMHDYTRRLNADLLQQLNVYLERFKQIDPVAPQRSKGERDPRAEAQPCERQQVLQLRGLGLTGPRRGTQKGRCTGLFPDRCGSIWPHPAGFCLRQRRFFGQSGPVSASGIIGVGTSPGRHPPHGFRKGPAAPDGEGCSGTKRGSLLQARNQHGIAEDSREMVG